MALPEQRNLKGLSQGRRWFPTGMGNSTGQASPCTVISQICEISSKFVLEVTMENLSCCFSQWLAQNQTLPPSGACKAYVMYGARDSLSSPPFLPLRVTRVRPGLSLAIPQRL